MKKILSAIAILASLAPAMASADVVTGDDLERLRATAIALDNGCKLLDFALTVQGGGMNAAPEWKTMPLGSGITMRTPWSPYWYLVGKQIPWWEGIDEYAWGTGRYAAGDACSLYREYTISVAPNRTLAQEVEVAKAEGVVPGSVETFSLNGKKTAVLSSKVGFCEAEWLSVEIVKGKKSHVVSIAKRCSDIDSEMLRMAASLK
jgi:hypothetical protein